MTAKAAAIEVPALGSFHIVAVNPTSQRYARLRPRAALKRDEIGMNHHRALGCCLHTIFSENRTTLFRIMR